MTEQGFAQFYSRHRQAIGAPYKDTEFLYPNNEPWPEQSFDFPYGQAPTVSNIPPEEAADWAQNVGKYYTRNALGSAGHWTPFGVMSAEFARSSFERNGITGYGALGDELFLELICEGLYSKYLGLLDPQDEQLFGVKDDANWQYLKSDQSCMKVVATPWPNEYVAPAIAVVRRKLPLTDATRWNYELVGIALAKKNDAGTYEYTPDLVFDAKQHQSTSAWWLAKFFVLQGAIHRINLVDHIKVHFPGDTVNAITKSVLPRWHLVQQLLLPHFRLTLPVNNVVLEGERSIINRDTWYPWSPVTAQGDEIRKLIPLAWAGGDFYWNQRNTSYPKYYFSTDPGSVPDPDAPASRRIQTFIGLQASRYAEFIAEYHAPILAFTREVIGGLPDPAATPEQDDLQWLEIRRWAYEIAKLVPGFPDELAIRSKEALAQVCATIIWNAAVVHSTDHSTLHMMIDKHPVPFILRVKPPANNATEVEQTIGDALDEQGRKYLEGALHGVEALLKKMLEKDLGNLVGGIAADALNGLAGKLVRNLEQRELTEGSVPLCWPTDLIYCKMADLLFYRPHNSSLLWDCDYGFLPRDKKQAAAEAELEQVCKNLQRPTLDDSARNRLQEIRARFQGALQQVNFKYYDESGVPKLYGSATTPDTGCVLNSYGFPKLLPGTKDTDVKASRMECCFGAGIQY